MQSNSRIAANVESPISEIRRLIRDKAIEAATEKMTAFLNRKFDFTVVSGSLIFELESALALNSLRAQFKTQEGEHLFLKCHHEEGEAGRVGEYYRAGILEEAGFPIDSALHQASDVGEQLVIYSFQDRQKTPELHGVAREIEAKGCPAAQVEVVAKAYDEFQKIIGGLQLKSLHEAAPGACAAEAVHALYHRRLVDDEDDSAFGARVRSFYLGRTLALPGNVSLPFEEFWGLKWEINGLRYDVSLREILERARDILKPSLAGPAAITAHGDDHTGNLLYNPESGEIKYFDPAFAGHDIPALQAGCKALYHVVFAHPNMLYDPDEFAAEVSVQIEGGVIKVQHDWDLTVLRRRFLGSQLEHVWKPLLTAMKGSGLLPENWETVVRSTLFCCPVLVKNLIAGAGSPNPLTEEASAVTFAIAVQLAAAPENGGDRVSEFFDAIKEAL